MDQITIEQTDSTSILVFLKRISLNKKALALYTLAGGLIGTALLFVLPVRYVAAAKIMPPRQMPSTAMLLNQLGASDGASSLAAMAGASLALKNPNDIYVAMLNSRPIADALIARFHLQQVYKKSKMSDVREKLADKTSIRSGKEGLISIEVTDFDKKRAASMANAYVEELSRIAKELSSTEAGRRAVFYEDQLAISKERLTQAEIAFQSIQQNKGLVQLEAQGRAAIEGLARLRAEIAAKEVEVQTMRSYAVEGNPRLSVAEKQLSSLREQASLLDKGDKGAGATGIGIGNLPTSGLDYLRAQRELQYQQALYNILLKQYEAAKLDESKDAVLIQVLEPAIEPDKRSSPRKAYTILLGLIGGFFAGCGMLFLRDSLQKDPILAAELRSLLQGLKQWN